MVLAVLSLLRDRLPCSENYWRYKRHYEMHMRILAGDQQNQDGSKKMAAAPNRSMGAMDEDCKSDGSGAVKRLAHAHMSFIMPLSPYSKDGFGRLANQSEGSQGSRPGSPQMQLGDV
mmetsp:Transcript_10808/g.13583  ORF Transcript_10808/g.13583 Transcript_10808/m.13583 type:complete len:117 (-) Transcript_10808:1857-2207(-)